MTRIPVPGPSLARWRLRAHWEATAARRYVERVMGRKLTADEFYVFAQPIRVQYHA